MEADIRLFKQLSLDLPEGSIIHADKGYTDYHYEDLLKEVGLHLKDQRKKRSKRPMVAWEEFLSKPARQYIETVFSTLSAYVFEEDPCGDAQRFRAEDRLLPVGFLHSMSVGGNSGYLVILAFFVPASPTSIAGTPHVMVLLLT